MFQSIKKTTIVTTVASAILLSGCAGTGMSNSETRAVMGSIVGGAIGREFGKGRGSHVATILGAAVGGYLGASLGRDLDSYDQGHVTTALSSTPDNRPVRWNNSSSGANYSFTPTQTYQSTINNRPTQCRHYTMLVDMGGTPQRVKGKACMVNGQWVTAN